MLVKYYTVDVVKLAEEQLLPTTATRTFSVGGLSLDIGGTVFPRPSYREESLERGFETAENKDKSCW